MFHWVDTILQWLFLLVAMVMTFFILLQEGKGGGLAALGGTKAAGVEGVTNPIRRFTVYLSAIFFTLAIVLGIMHRPEKSIFAAKPAAASTTMESAAKPADAAKAGDAAKPAEAVKPAEAAKTDAKPAETKPADTAKPAEAAKTDAKPADAKPVEATKAADAAKPANAEKPAEAPKTDAAKPDGSKKTDDKK